MNASTVADRVRWLRENDETWKHVNWNNLNAQGYRRERKRLVKLMKSAGLYSSTTYFGDVNVLRLIELALMPALDKSS